MTETLPPDAVNDDAQINQAVQCINERVAAHVYWGALEIGEYVLTNFFDNNIELASSRNGHKPVSYRKFCIHPDLMISRITLTNMLKKAAQSQFLVEKGISEDSLNYSQKTCLTRLENNDRKIELAQACMDEKLKIHELKLRAQEICEQSNPSTRLPARKLR